MTKNYWITLLLIFTVLGMVYSQEKVTIPGTNLVIEKREGFTVDENSATIYGDSIGMSFVGMSGLSFSSQKSDLDNIEAGYAEKGIIVKSKESGKIGSYEAILIKLESVPSIYQVFMGDERFCILINVIAEGSHAIDYDFINSYLGTIEFTGATENPLEEHANFEFIKDDENWEVQSFMSNTFAFNHSQTEDAVLLLQLPPQTLLFSPKEQLAEQFKTKFLAAMPGLKIAKEEVKKINDFDGYQVLFELEEENENIAFIYLYIFGMEKSAISFQGMGKVNDQATIERFEAFIANLKEKD